ncbi:MAG: hypothetical protein ONB43_10115 [candidate division KSB1 bacterium]|nr:hypothetical protein [candidate division KSB1 bacterium]
MQQFAIAVHRVVFFSNPMGDQRAVNAAPFHFFEQHFGFTGCFNVFRAALADHGVTVEVNAFVHFILLHLLFLLLLLAFQKLKGEQEYEKE